MLGTKNIDIQYKKDQIKNEISFIFEEIERTIVGHKPFIYKMGRSNNVWINTLIYISYFSVFTIFIFKLIFTFFGVFFSQRMFDFAMMISIIILLISLSNWSFIYFIDFTYKQNIKNVLIYLYFLISVMTIITNRIMMYYIDFTIPFIYEIVVFLPIFLAVMKFIFLYFKNLFNSLKTLNIKQILFYFFVPDFILIITNKEEILKNILSSNVNKVKIVNYYDQFISFVNLMIIENDRSKVEFVKDMASVIARVFVYFLPIFISIVIFLQNEIYDILNQISGNSKMMIIFAITIVFSFILMIFIYLANQFFKYEKKRQIIFLVKEILLYAKII